MNVVDSSGWLEFFANGPNAGFFAPAIVDTRALVVPTLSIYEVFKRVLQQTDEGKAYVAVAAMQEGTVVALSATIAMDATRVSLKEKLPMADAVIYATARACGATLWTQDADFETFADVKYVPRKEP